MQKVPWFKLVFGIFLLGEIMGVAISGGATLQYPSLTDAEKEKPVSEWEESKDIADRSMTQALEQAFHLDDGIDEDGLAVRTVNGIVTVSGSVTNILAKERAIHMAERIKGVRAVINRIGARLREIRSDEAIRHDIEAALAEDPATRDSQFTVEVEAGLAKLGGEVQSWQLKELALQVVKGVKGVKDVTNTMSVQPQRTVSDSHLEQEIRQRLESDVFIDDQTVSVKVHNRKVTLSGVVGSVAEKTRTMGQSWSSGVTAVDASDLEVKWWDAKPMQHDPRTVLKSDQAIHRAVKDALLFDPRVISFDPHVHVQDGIVTLTGTVDNLRAKQAAGQNAKHTTGVIRVKNLLKVRPEDSPADTEIADNIRAALNRDSSVEGVGLHISVKNGTAELTGMVDSSFQKAHVQNLVSKVNGVVAVRNRLHIIPPTLSTQERDLVQDIKNKLWWNPDVDSYQISVAVEDGVAILKGTVSSWVERIQAEQNAREAGAKEVRNLLQLRQGSDFRPAS